MCSRKWHGSIDLDDDRKHYSANGLQDVGFPSAESAALLAPRMVLNMYEQRFGLHRKPFQTVTKAHDFFASSSFNELLPSVLHALQTDLGVAVLTGPAGVGKSVSLEQIQRHLGSTAQTVLLRGGSLKGSPDLLYMLHRRLLKLQPDGSGGQDSSATDIVRRYEVVERLERVASFWGPLTILLDDAQLVNQDVFSELRSLLEEGHDGRRFARLLIAGPLQLEEVLAESANSHLARKIRIHSFLQPLRSDEAIQYLDHHFSLAGGQLTEAFAADALELIVAAADGVPQCLNLLADESLMVCEETECDKVSRESVNQALARLQHLPYSWNVSMVAETVDDDFDDGDFDENSQSSFRGDSIEIGEFPSDAFSDSRSVTTDTAEGVFEIGAASPVEKPIQAAVVEVTDSFEEPVSSVSDIALEANESGDAAEELEADLVATELLDSETDDAEFDAAAAEIIGSEGDQLQPAESVDVASEHSVRDAWENAVEISAEEFQMLDNNVEDVESTDALDQDSSTGLVTNDSSVAASLLAEFVDVEDEDGSLEVDDSQPVSVSETISHYEPWAPAGEWPTSPLPVHAASESGFDTADEIHASTSEVDVANATELESDTAEFTDPNLIEPVWDIVATPVVDRFTWAELGRPSSDGTVESADQFHGLSDYEPTAQLAAAWPPVTAGVAPTSQIPVSQLDDEYAELLNDLGLLIDATAERHADDPVVSTEAQELSIADVVPSLVSAESLQASKGPEGTIEELQLLIHQEQQLDKIADGSDRMPEMHLPSDSNSAGQSSVVSDVDSEQSLQDSHSPTAAPQFFSMSQVEIEAVDEALSDGNIPDDSQRSGHHSENDIQDVTSNGDTNSPDGHDPDVVAFQQIVEERDEWMEQQTLLAQIVSDEKADQEQALPNALRQARRQQRRSVLTMGLRQAAGAETVSEVQAVAADSDLNDSNHETEAEADDQDRPVSLPMSDAKKASVDNENALQASIVDTADEATEKTGFSNLFTRLRRRRGKAS